MLILTGPAPEARLLSEEERKAVEDARARYGIVL